MRSSVESLDYWAPLILREDFICLEIETADSKVIPPSDFYLLPLIHHRKISSD